MTASLPPNRTYVSTSTTGTGSTVALGAAIGGLWLAASDAGGLTDGYEYQYVIEQGSDFEINVGVYDSGAGTIGRGTPLRSKISGVVGTSKLDLNGSAKVLFPVFRENLASLGGGTPGGSDKQIQFNDSGAFGGDPNLIWDAGNYSLKMASDSGGYTAILTAPKITGPFNYANSEFIFGYNDAGDLFNRIYSFGAERSAFGYDFYVFDFLGNYAPFSMGGGSISFNGYSRFRAQLADDANYTVATVTRAGGTAQNLIGLQIDDMSQWGLASSKNIFSKGVSSTNVFEGTVVAQSHLSAGNNLKSGYLTDTFSPGSSELHESLSVGNKFTPTSYTAATSAQYHGIVSENVISPRTAAPQPAYVQSYSGYFKQTVDASTTLGVSQVAGIAGGTNWLPASPILGSLVQGLNYYVYTEWGSLVTDVVTVDTSIRHNGTATNVIGLRSGLAAWGDLTNRYGLKLEDGAGGYASDHVATNAYGVWVDDHSGLGSTIAYNIFSKGSSSKNVFEGAVMVGSTTAPSSALHVTAGAIELEEMSAPSAPAANHGRIYLDDDGAGKTRLMIKFSSGAAQQIAIQP